MRVGELIANRFEIERFVARGGMGQVYRALDRRTGRPVALKLLSVDDPSLVARMALEARALTELNHPAVVRHVAHDAVEGGSVYVAMEWLEGVTLSRRMRMEPLTVDEALAMGARVAEGLGAAHSRGMVHRDVKPANVILVEGDPRRPKILDFGIVRHAHARQLTATGVGMGTPEYMAPEQVRCERELGPQVDVFALGTVLYRCLAGQPAFQGERVEAVLAKIAMFDQPPRVSDVRPEIPPVVDDLLARMMAYRPEDRPQSGTAAAEAIGSVRAVVGAGQPASRELSLPAITRRERRPVSFIVAEVDDAEADTVPAGVFDLANSDPPSGDDARGATIEGPVEEMMVARGPSDGLRLLPRLRRSLEPYGARVEVLLNGSFVAMVSGGSAATDLAARSARCALALRELLPQASIGVATRRAAVGRHGLDAIIDHAAAAVRSHSHAIALDGATRDLLPAEFETAEAADGGFELLGEGTGEQGERAAARLLLGRETPCVGRGRLLRQLEAAFFGTVEDRAAEALVLVGDAGVGKSRIRAELVERLRREQPQLRTVFAWGDPLRAQVPYGLVARALRGALGVPETGPEAQRAAIADRVAAAVAEPERERVSVFLGEIAGVSFDDEDRPALRAARGDPALLAEQKRRAFEDWLAAECAAVPLLVLVEDLHWADPESVELLGAGLRAAADLPLLLLAFARPELRERFPELGKAWRRQEIPIDPLRPTDCEALVREILGDAVDADTCRRLVGCSDGNPFYLEELIRVAATGDAGALPESVVASLQMRIANLPEPARHVLRAASVFGGVFWVDGVVALVGRDHTLDEISSWLEALELEELVERRDSAALSQQVEYRFRHDLVREAAYQMLTDADRVAGHRLAGHWLQEAGESEAVVLAEHFAGGGAAEQALDWFERAADQALARRDQDQDMLEALGQAAHYYRRAGETAARVHAHGTAIVFFERAAALYAPLDPIEGARCRLLLARAREHVGERALALDDLERAEKEAREAGAGVRPLVEILLERADLEGRAEGEGALERARALAHAARDLASEAGDRELEARALTELAILLTQQDTEESRALAVKYAEVALNLSRDRGDVATSLWRLGNALLARQDLSRAAALYRDALAAAEHGKDDMLCAAIEGNLGMAAFRRWNLEEAIERTGRALKIYERIGHHTRKTSCQINLGTFYLLLGEVSRAAPLLEEALASARGDWVLSTLCRESLADLERCRGDEARAQEHLEAAALTCERAGAAQKQAIYLGLRAESLWASGRFGDALALVERSVEISEGGTLSYALIQSRLGLWEQAASWFSTFARAEPDPDRRLVARLALARVTWWGGDRAEAARLADDALASVRETGLPRYLLPCKILGACIAGRLGDALALYREAGAACGRPALADAALDLAQAVLESDDLPEDVSREFVEVTSDVDDAGLSYRVEWARAEACERLGRDEESVACLERARAAVQAWLAQIEGSARDAAAAHPWVEAALRPRPLS